MATLMFAYPLETGITTGKFVRRRKSDGAYWSTVGAAFEAYNAANIANYGIAATENGVSGDYSATDPAETTEGDYRFVKAAGASLAVSDLISGIRWQDRAGPDAYAALTDAQAEPGQGAPAVNASPLTKLAHLFKAWRNKKTQTASQLSIYDDAGTTVDQKSAITDDGTTTTFGEVATGP